MSLTDDLERLASLHKGGALSDAEFASAKARAIGAAPTHASDTDSVGAWLRALRRSRTDRWFGGVCGGLAPMSGLPAWAWRLIFASLLICGGTGLMLYVILWIFLPLDDGIVDAGTATLRTS